nr:glycosyltransferase family 9 protein [uncultured Mucilaginibacter sp.]
MPTFNLQKTEKLKKIDRIFKAFYLFPKNKKAYPPLKKDELFNLVILGFLLIGDTIMYLPALRIIRKNFPNAKITLVCEKAVRTILEEQGLIDDFVIIKCPWIAPVNYSLKNLYNFFSAIRLINRKKYDLAIDFRGDWRNIFYLNFISAKRKASYNFTGGEYMLTDIVTPNSSIVHFTEESLYFLQQLGCEFTDAERLPSLTVSAADNIYTENFKIQNNLNGKLVIGVHPGTSQEVKRWDEQKYSELMIKLAAVNTDAAFIIYEGPNERNTVAQIENELKANNVDYVIVNKTLHEYILMLSICDIVICNDSGAAHIASAFAIPTVVIFGNVDPQYVIPYGADIRRIISHQMECKPCYQSFCKFGHNLCIKSVGVDEVYNGVMEIVAHIKTLI